jgi:hypothetical protein
MNRLKIISFAISFLVVFAMVFASAGEVKKETTKKQSSTKSVKSAKKWQDTFNVDKKNLGPVGENTYFILQPGYKQIFIEGNITDTLTVLKETKIIDGVEVGIIEDREEKNGQPIEVTKDYFAFDSVTKNVYYFGEDVDYYKDGKVTGHGGTWISGVNGARFGLFVPGKIKVGDKFYQEKAPEVTMDRVEIKQIGLKIQTPAGTFENCIKVEETTPLEPEVKDYKWYAPGVGMIKDGDMPLNKIEKETK